MVKSNKFIEKTIGSTPMVTLQKFTICDFHNNLQEFHMFTKISTHMDEMFTAIYRMLKFTKCRILVQMYMINFKTL